MKIPAKLIKTANILLSILIFIVFYTHIIHKIQTDHLWDSIHNGLFQINGFKMGLLIGVGLLMLINWSIESVKMQILLRRIQSFSFLSTLKIVITGVSFSCLFPNRYGEFIGRSVAAKNQKFQVGLVSLITSLAQTIITLLCGFTALLFYLFQNQSNPFFNYSILILTFCVLIFCFLIYFKLSLVQKLCTKIKWTFLQKYIQKLTLLKNFSTRELITILALSFTRYLVFFLQFYLILVLFKIQISFLEACLLIPVYYLILMIIPVFFITEPGVRGSVAIFLFNLFHTNSSTSIFISTTTIWSINILIPALIGSFFLLRLKFWSHE